MNIKRGFHFLILSVFCLLFATTSYARDRGDIERTCTYENSAVNVAVIVYDKVEFDCGGLGRLTIKQMNDKGWELTGLISSPNIYTTNNMHIETRTSWTAIIEK